MADKQISQLVAATTINDDDLFVMQQGGTAKKLSGQKLADFVYQSAADIYGDLESMIAGVEQTMTATKNYVVDNLVVAAHGFYHITSNIADGETIIPGTNCYATTVASEILSSYSSLAADIASFGNVAQLIYQVVT